MTHDHNIAPLTALLFTLGTLGGCALNTDEIPRQSASADGGSQELSASATPTPEQALRSAGPACCTRYVPPPTDAELLADLEDVRMTFVDEATREAYFAESISPLSTTPDGGHFIFYEGPAGLGAFYRSPLSWPKQSFVPVYGEILTLWGDKGYEQWNGYFTFPERDARACKTQGALREQDLTDIPAPELATDGSNSESPGFWVYHRTVCWAPGRIWLQKDAAYQYDEPRALTAE